MGLVFRGTKVKTGGDLKKSDLVLKEGRLVSRRASAAAKKSYAKNKKASQWALAVKKARKALGIIKGFVPIGGKTAKGKALYAKARSFYNADASTQKIGDASAGVPP